MQTRRSVGSMGLTSRLSRKQEDSMTQDESMDESIDGVN